MKSLSRDVIDIEINQIIVGDRLRKLDSVKLTSLIGSIGDLGLQTPISVHRYDDGTIHLVAGLHRLQAAKGLKWTTIPCTFVDLDDLRRQLWEIDENLCRADLTALERGAHLAARKAIYEQLHPGTKAGTSQALGMNQALGHDVAANLAPTFVEDAAAKTGLSERTIERDIHRAEHIAPGVQEEIWDTPIADSRVQLDALAAASHEEQVAAVSAVKTGTAEDVREVLQKRSSGRKRSASASEPHIPPTIRTEESTNSLVGRLRNIRKSPERFLVAIKRLTENFSTDQWVELLRFIADDQVVKAISDYQRAIVQLENEAGRGPGPDERKAA